jgi:hypothetical protein
MSATMLELSLGVIGGLVAMEIWGWTEPLAHFVIRAVTWPLGEPWRGIRRQELAALVDPCAGERRLTAFLRLTTVVLRLSVHDVAVGRVRPMRGRALGAALAVWLASALIVTVGACFLLLGGLIYLLILLVFPAMVTCDVLVWINCDLHTCVIVTSIVVLAAPVFGFTTFVSCAMLPGMLKPHRKPSRAHKAQGTS